VGCARCLGRSCDHLAWSRDLHGRGSEHPGVPPTVGRLQQPRDGCRTDGMAWSARDEWPAQVVVHYPLGRRPHRCCAFWVACHQQRGTETTHSAAEVGASGRCSATKNRREPRASAGSLFYGLDKGRNILDILNIHDTMFAALACSACVGHSSKGDGNAAHHVHANSCHHVDGRYHR